MMTSWEFLGTLCMRPAALDTTQDPCPSRELSFRLLPLFLSQGEDVEVKIIKRT